MESWHAFSVVDAPRDHSSERMLGTDRRGGVRRRALVVEALTSLGWTQPPVGLPGSHDSTAA